MIWTEETEAVFILGSKPPMWTSFLQLGLRIQTEGGKLGSVLVR